MISWRPYEKKDIDLVHFDESAFTYNGGLANTCSGPGIHSYTMLEDGKPIAIMGITQMWEGVAEVWSLLSDQAKTFHAGHNMLKKVRWALETFQRELHIHRFQATALATHKEGCRFLEAMGFSLEAKLMNYGHDKRPHCLYSRCY